MANLSSPWIVRRAPRSAPALRLFCFPHAGAGSVIYREWFDALPRHVEVCAIEPPGRFARRKERAFSDVLDFTKALEPELEPYLDVPYAFFGYSLGALMAFECARSLRRRGKEPKHLVVAACKAPHMPRRQAPIRNEPSSAFVRELERRYGPLEPVIRQDPEMLELVVQIMRVDLGMVETHSYSEEPAFACPILAIGGTDDASLVPEELEGWGAHTAAAFRSEWLPGGHFFLRERGIELRKLVERQITEHA